VARAVFEQLGGFESILQPSGGKELGEDVWLGWRARRAGARTVFEPQALVHHAVLPRGPRGYVEERARLYFFPELVRRIPELREEFLYRRWFLNRRTAALDLALIGAAAALACRRPAPLLAAIPYANAIRRHALHSDFERTGLLVAAELAADAVGAAALAIGSLRSRSPVL
jgi:hypothetical protein